MGKWIVRALGTALLAACGSEPPEAVSNPNGTPPDPGAAVAVDASEERRQELEALLPALEESVSLDDFRARYAFTPRAELGYDPSAAQNLDLIQGSALALSDGELETLKERGFVISSTREFPSFAYGYTSLYAQDLPLYISADSILDAMHRSFDEILKAIEEQQIIGDLEELLDGLRAGLASSELPPELAPDLDFYLAVARGLLSGTHAAPVAGADASQIAAWTDRATAAGDPQSLELFGSARDLDLSRFKPRGHYTDSEQLERFFRAMVWLGRIDFRLIETQGNGEQLFRRRQFDAMLALHELVGEAELVRYRAMDDTLRAFVGLSDNMTLDEVAPLLGDLGVLNLAQASALGDQEIAEVIARGGYGEQSIASDLMVKGTDNPEALPLNRSFALLGQRYTLDSHVFSNVVWDRIPEMRMLPDPLDVAFAVFQNDQAGALLDAEVERYAYAADLHRMRVLSDAHDETYWNASLYNRWLGALRELSPVLDGEGSAGPGMPAVTGTDAWGRRLLDAQLGSWAELRRDTILFVKPSYSTGASCEYPDAYVDPYPEFFAKIAAFAEFGQTVAASLRAPHLAEEVTWYFETLRDVALRLQGMAESERAGTPFDEEQMRFVNDTVVRSKLGCDGSGPDVIEGWYAGLFFNLEKSVEADPTIADVHTQPTDEGGNDLGRVLHVATGYPRMMVTTTDSCTGPRAYAGLAFAYHEIVRDQWQRLSDEEWKAELERLSYVAPDPEWLAPALAP